MHKEYAYNVRILSNSSCRILVSEDRMGTLKAICGRETILYTTPKLPAPGFITEIVFKEDVVDSI